MKLDGNQPLELKLHLPQENIAQYKKQIPLKIRSRIRWQNYVDGTKSVWYCLCSGISKH